MEKNKSVSDCFKEKLQNFFSHKISLYEEKFAKDLVSLDFIKDDFYNIANDSIIILKIVDDITNLDNRKEPLPSHILWSPIKTEYKIIRERNTRNSSKTPNKVLSTMATSPEINMKLQEKFLKNHKQQQEILLHEATKNKTRNNSFSSEEKVKNKLVERKKNKNVSTKKMLNSTMFSNSKLNETTNKDTPIKPDNNQKDKKGILRKYSVLVKSTQKKASFYNKHISEKQHTKSIHEIDKPDPENKHNELKDNSEKITNGSNENKLLIKNTYEEIVDKKCEVIEPVKPFTLISKKEIKVISNGIFENISFSEKSKKCLSIFCYFRYFDLKKRIDLVSLLDVNEEIRKSIFEKEFDFIDSYNQVINKKIETFENDPKNKDLINKSFIPSKTSSNGLNFLTKEEDMSLLKYEQKEEVINVIKLIYLFLNEDYPNISNNKLIEDLLGRIFEKYKAPSLKSLILNNIAKGSIRMDQFNKIKVFIKENPSCLNSMNLIKINKGISYITFFLKDLYEFLQLKSEDGTLLILIRELKDIYQENVLKLGKLKLLS